MPKVHCDQSERQKHHCFGCYAWIVFSGFADVLVCSSTWYQLTRSSLFYLPGVDLIVFLVICRCVIYDDLNLLSLVRSGLMIRFNFLQFWDAVLGHNLFRITWVFGTIFVVADSRPAFFFSDGLKFLSFGFRFWRSSPPCS